MRRIGVNSAVSVVGCAVRGCLVLTALALLAGCGVAGASPTDSGGPGGTIHRQIVSGGKTRDYYLYRPASLPASGRVPLEVVLAAHGFSTADTAIYNQGASNNGFLLAYAVSNAGWGEVGDEKFVADVIDELVRTESADSRRVYVVGGSAGGFEAYTVACGPQSAKIAGVGIIFGGITTTSANLGASDVCHPQQPLSVFAIHGTTDGFVPYNGQCRVGKEHGNTICVISQAQTMAFWSHFNDCRQTPSTSSGPKHRVDEWQGCKSNAGVELVTVVGGGHTYQSLTVDGIEPGTMLLKFLDAHAPSQVVAVAARVIGTNVTRQKGGIKVRIRLTLGEDVKAKLYVLAGSRTLASRTARLQAGTTSVSLTLPARTRPGAYKVKLVLTDAKGNQRVFVRRITIRKG
jgi:polyhydroxybutyrate depolymerase